MIWYLPITCIRAKIVFRCHPRYIWMYNTFSCFQEYRTQSVSKVTGSNLLQNKFTWISRKSLRILFSDQIIRYSRERKPDNVSTIDLFSNLVVHSAIFCVFRVSYIRIYKYIYIYILRSFSVAIYFPVIMVVDYHITNSRAPVIIFPVYK